MASDDWAASFPDLVRTNAAPLEQRGFRLVTAGEGEVRYESSAGVFIQFFRARDDFYVGFRIGLTDNPQDALTETEVLLLAGQTLAGQYPTDRDQLEEAVQESVRRLTEFGQGALSGVAGPYEVAKVLRRNHTEKYSR